MEEPCSSCDPLRMEDESSKNFDKNFRNYSGFIKTLISSFSSNRKEKRLLLRTLVKYGHIAYFIIKQWVELVSTNAPAFLPYFIPDSNAISLSCSAVLEGFGNISPVLFPLLKCKMLFSSFNDRFLDFFIENYRSSAISQMPSSSIDMFDDSNIDFGFFQKELTENHRFEEQLEVCSLSLSILFAVVKRRPASLSFDIHMASSSEETIFDSKEIEERRKREARKSSSEEKFFVDADALLLLSSSFGFVELAKTLLLLKKNLNFTDPNDCTPLMEASSAGFPEIVKLLIENELDINAKSGKSESTPLLYAAASGNLECVKLLVNNGADLHVLNKNDYCVMMVAADYGHVNIVSYLFEIGVTAFPRIIQPDDREESPLTLAICGGHLETVQCILETFSYDNLHLHEALLETIAYGFEEIVYMLIEKGASPSRMVDESESPLGIAVFHGREKIFNILLDKGAKIDEINCKGETILMEFCEEGNLKAVEFLFDHGADINWKTTDELETPLMKAAYAGSWEIVEFLIEKGAHMSAGSSTPLIEACRGGHETLVDILLRKTNDLNEPLFVSIEYDKEMALIVAVEEGYIDLCKSLIDNDASLDYEGMDGMTALMKAAVNGHFEIAELLISKGAKVDILSCSLGATALSLACVNSHLSVIKLLLSAEADSLIRLKDGSTCTIEAARNGHREVLELLHREKFKPMMSSKTQFDDKNAKIKKRFSEGACGISYGATAENQNVRYNDLKSQKNSEFLRNSGQVSSIIPQNSCQCCSKEFERSTPIYRKIDLASMAKCSYNLHDLESEYEFVRKKSFSLPNFLNGMDEASHANDEIPFRLADSDLRASLPKNDDDLQDGHSYSSFTHEEKNHDAKTNFKDSFKGSCLSKYILDCQTESNRETALMIAASFGYKSVVDYLICHGANLELKDKKGCTALILAAAAGHASVVERILAAGANIEERTDGTKDTALSLACSNGRTEVVELLLKRGAKIEHCNISDYTPLALASSGGHFDVVNILLKYGAEIGSLKGSKMGITPLMLAAMSGHKAVSKLLLENRTDINAQIETNRNTALTLACFKGHTEIVELLLDYGANYEHKAKTGLTPLMEAANGGYTDVGEVLINAGADPNSFPSITSRDTALTIAANKGHNEFVELLIEHGAHIDACNKKGCTALSLACQNGHLQVVETLINFGSNIDVRDSRGRSPLVISFQRGYVQTVNLMVKYVKQFPGDQECKRYLNSITDDEELKQRCYSCFEIIKQAKQERTISADKEASKLLLMLVEEEEQMKAKKLSKKRRNEKKKAKLKARKMEKKVSPEEAEKFVEKIASSSSSEEPILDSLSIKKEHIVPKESYVLAAAEVRKEPLNKIISHSQSINLAPTKICVDHRSENTKKEQPQCSNDASSDKSYKPTTTTYSSEREYSKSYISSSTSDSKVSAIKYQVSRENSVAKNFRSWSSRRIDILPRRRGIRMWLPAKEISRVIGLGGNNINAIRTNSGAFIEIEKQTNEKEQFERQIVVLGNPLAVRRARKMIDGLVSNFSKDVADIINEVLNENEFILEKNDQQTQKMQSSLPLSVQRNYLEKEIPSFQYSKSVNEKDHLIDDAKQIKKVIGAIGSEKKQKVLSEGPSTPTQMDDATPKNGLKDLSFNQRFSNERMIYECFGAEKFPFSPSQQRIINANQSQPTAAISLPTASANMNVLITEENSLFNFNKSVQNSEVDSTLQNYNRWTIPKVGQPVVNNRNEYSNPYASFNRNDFFRISDCSNQRRLLPTMNESVYQTGMRFPSKPRLQSSSATPPHTRVVQPSDLATPCARYDFFSNEKSINSFSDYPNMLSNYTNGRFMNDYLQACYLPSNPYETNRLPVTQPPSTVSYRPNFNDVNLQNSSIDHCSTLPSGSHPYLNFSP